MRVLAYQKRWGFLHFKQSTLQKLANELWRNLQMDLERSAEQSGCFSIRKIQIYLDFGPSGVRALPLADCTNEGGHYKWHFFLFLYSFFLLPAHC